MKKLFFCAGFLSALTFISQAATIRVTNINNTGAGSLRQAIITANTTPGADTIRFDAATNGLSINLVSDLNITGSLVVIGNGILNTKITDDASGTVFSIGPGINVKIKNLSIINVENGVTRYYSTGSVGDLEIVGCTISGNGAGTGLIYQCSDGSATIDSCQFSALNNGVQIDSYLNVNLRNCFATNCTSIGFAIYDPSNGFINVTNNTVSNSDNGISLPEAASGLIANNTVYNISQTGIYVELSGSIVPSMKFINNTVSDCMTAFGIYEQGSSASAASLTLANNILFNSSYMDFDLYSNDLSGGNPAISSDIVGKSSSVYGIPAWYSTSDPLLVSGGPQNNGGFTPTIAIQNGSPAINNGNPTAAPAKDQRGYSRNGVTDIGAYELNGILTCSNTGLSVVTACGSYKWINGITYTSGNNTATYTLKNKAGCDSVVTLNLTILKSTGSTDIKTDCGSYKWIDGITYTANNNTATYTLKNRAGCDSVVTLNLTILKSTGSTDVKTACGSYKWINGITYTANNNTATYTLKNKAGCDSVVMLNLTILKSTGSTDVKTACGSYKWIDGVTYTSGNNTATYTLKNKAGCDSVVALNLTILRSTGSTDVKTACGSYKWIDGITYTANNNTATYTLKNKAGCDSVITLNLTILKSTASTDIKTACGSYKWIDGITYTLNNNTATYTLKNKAGCDSVVTLNLTILKSTGSTDVKSACGSYNWIDGNTYTGNNNTAIYTMKNRAGCDSIVTLDLTIKTVDTTITGNGYSITANAADASYKWLDCNSKYAAINNAANQTYFPSASGSFAVEITQNSCVDTSGCFSVLSVGLEKNEFEKSIVIYPNPTKGTISVDLGSHYKSVSATISDARGRVISSKEFDDSNKLDIEIKGATGYYFVEIAATGKKKAIFKIFKE